MSEPVLSTVGADLYADLAPLAYDDANRDWALALLCQAIAEMLQPVDDLVRDDDNGPGWSKVLDITRCPTAWLPWLGQFVGVTVDTTLDDADQRTQITTEAGFQRGTPAAMVAAAQATLTGAKVVIMRERHGGDAYALQVITYTAQTPDSAATHAALLAQKPAGIVLDYEVHDGQDWQQLIDGYSTWAAVVAHYPTWQDVINDTPTTP